MRKSEVFCDLHAVIEREKFVWLLLLASIPTEPSQILKIIAYQFQIKGLMNFSVRKSEFWRGSVCVLIPMRYKTRKSRKNAQGQANMKSTFMRETNKKLAHIFTLLYLPSKHSTRQIISWKSTLRRTVHEKDNQLPLISLKCGRSRGFSWSMVEERKKYHGKSRVVEGKDIMEVITNWRSKTLR